MEPISPIQAMFDGMAANRKRERAKTQMTLGKLIKQLGAGCRIRPDPADYGGGRTIMEIIQRTEDMSPTGWLRLLKEDDGDMIVVVQQTHDVSTGRKFDHPVEAQIQFCTYQGGGRSHHTLKALWNLYEAMKKDGNQFR